MKKRLLAILGAILLCQFLFGADYIIKGNVFDKATNEPLGFVTVALMRADSSLVCGVTSDAAGKYQISAAAGKYTLKYCLMGYKDQLLPLELTAAVVMPDVAMEEDAAVLSAARVVERIPLMEMKLDKVVVNISQSAFAQTSNALELLKKSPGVFVDKDGNVTLNGRQVAVWIDGRPSYLDGKSLQALLRSTEGSTIEKFELMEHPSSKYDAEGQGGIINIKTKRNMVSGLTGDIGASGGGMYFCSDEIFPWQENVWANLAYRTKKTNTVLNLSQGRWEYDANLTSDTTLDGTYKGLTREVTDDFMAWTAMTYKVKLSNDWFIDDKNTLGVILSLPGMKSKTDSPKDKNTSLLYSGDNLVGKDCSSTLNYDNSLRATANLNYTHVFDPQKGQELTANVDWYHNTGEANNSQNIWEMKTSAPEVWNESYRKLESQSRLNIYSAKVDFQSVFWGSTMFETGLKWSLSNADNSTDRKGSAPEDNKYTAYEYKENIAAAYFSFSRKFGQKWSAKVGLRAEYTNSFGNWITENRTTPREHFGLFPTAYVGFTPSEKWQYNLSYSRRLKRPSYYSLNPAEEYLDAHTYLVGNPDLYPEISNNVSFQTCIHKYFSISATYQNKRGLIEQVPTIKPDGTQVMKFENFGNSDGVYLVFSASAFPITKWLEWTLNLTGGYMNSHVDEIGYSNASFALMGMTNFTFSLPKDWTIELQANLRSPMAYGYFKLHTNWYSQLGVKKTILDGRLTFNLDLEDICRSSSENMDILDAKGNTVSVLKQKYLSQRVIFGVSWNFGKAQATRRRNVGHLEEESRASGGGGGMGGMK